MQPTQSKAREAVKLAIAFTLGALTGETVDVVGSDDQPATAIVGCGDSGTDTGTDTTDSGTDASDTGERPPGYCEAYPEQCNQGGECPPIVVDATGKQTGGCLPETVEFVCCSPENGCWAVASATACGNASLYWLDCESGEQLYDPVTGKASVICHD